jgi:hypothetical protein
MPNISCRGSGTVEKVNDALMDDLTMFLLSPCDYDYGPMYKYGIFNPG